MDEMKVLVRKSGETRQIAALYQGRLVEYLEDEGDKRSMVGAVVQGLVERVLPSVGAAFVKIGQPLNGFLPLKEMESFVCSGSGKPLVTGQEVLVQVKKDAKGEKGAFLTRDIALPGVFAVWMPLNRHVGVSGRVTDAVERERLLELGRELANGEAGVIMRHAALAARREEVGDEVEALKMLWVEVLQNARYARPPAVLYREVSELGALLRDHAGRYQITVHAVPEECAQEGFIPLITQAVPEECKQEKSLQEGYIREVPGPVNPSHFIALFPQTEIELTALWQGAHIPGQLQGALNRRVSLASGGTLVIDEREALTTIDVNTAKFVGNSDGKGIALEQNLAACEEIARQIRLRNLGGILLIDFMDMRTDEERTQVREALEQHLRRDRVKTVIHGFTSLGLLEMTRKRTRESLSGVLTGPCPHCGETGRRMSNR